MWAEVARDFPAERTEAMVADEIGLGGLDAALSELAAARIRGRVLVDPGR